MWISRIIVNSFLLLGIQVLLFDPLYSWSLSPAQLYALEAKRAEINTTLDKSKSSSYFFNDQYKNTSKSMNKENFKMNTLQPNENSLIFPSNQQLYNTNMIDEKGNYIHRITLNIFCLHFL